MSYATTRSADHSRGKIGSLVALPRFVAEPSAIEAFHVDFFDGAVEDGQLVHVFGPERDGLLAVGIVDLHVNYFTDFFHPPLDIFSSRSLK